MPLRRFSETTRERLLFGLLVAMIVLTFGGINENRQRAAEGQEAHAALCVLRADLHTRSVNGENLLEENKGPMIFGIPRATIQTSIAGQRRTLEALSNLDCKEGS